MSRIYFEAWGYNEEIEMPAYAVDKNRDCSFTSDIIADAIARKNGLAVCAGPKSERISMSSGEPDEYIYQMTLGKPCKTGGYSVVSPVWFSYGG